MSNERKLKIAIISDLHCHPTNSNGNTSTYLQTDKLRTPVNDHPVEHLKHIIKKDKLSTDLTLCPGDFADKSNLQGLISGWGFSIEISDELKSKNIIATIGNHDVDVFGNTSTYSLQNVKGLKRGFPIKDEKTSDTLWSKGCAFIENKNYRILVINSTHFHHNPANSHNGKISEDALDYIDQYLSTNDDDKIKIAMSHHPPISHPNRKLGEDDKIVNGDELLNLLGKYSFDIFIYGHKHDPFIKYHNTTSGSHRIPLFSSGSFSAITNNMFAGLRNTFHIMEITKRNKVCKGKISTWTFLPNDGWKKNLDESAFAPESGFGNEKTIEQIFEDLKKAFGDQKKITWKEASEKVEDINYLIPADSEKLYEKLKQNNYNTDVHLWKGPVEIYNLNSI